MVNETDFLVLTSHRSGSTWMVDVLNNLDHTSAFSEMFLPPAEKVRENRPYFQLQSQTQTYLNKSVRSYPAYNYVPDKGRRIRPFSVFRYLDALYDQQGSTGFKLMYGQLAAYPEIWPYVMAKKISVVHLIRENVLDIIISHEFRKTTRIAHTVDGEHENLPPVQIELDPEDTLSRMRSMQQKVGWARRLLDITRIPALEVVYEDLARDPVNFVPVFEFLGVGDGNTPPKSRLVKIVRSDYPELIRNYDEIEQRLNESEFAALLTKKEKWVKMVGNKTVVIGMDGAPFDLIKKWASEGKLPHLQALIDRGAFGVLKSTIPVHSPTAWASFITGLNPGNHGVFDFVRREPDSYRLRVVRADQYSGTSLWRLLSDHGPTVGVMNVPMTYPPEAVNGYLLSGLGTPDFAAYSFPPEMSDKLNVEGYRVNKEFFFKEERQDEWLADIHEITDLRGETAVKLMREEPWDFFMIVFRNSDEICHFYWHHMDETHPRHDPAAPARYRTAILDLYQHIDEWIGRIVESAGEGTNIVVMSDHGAGPLYKDVFLNEWLIEQGWLKLRELSSGQRGWLDTLRKVGLTRENISDTLTRLKLHRLEVLIKNVLGDRIEALPRDDRLEFVNAVDWSQTKAYSYGYYGQVFINLKGREPQGIVDPDQEYVELRNEIKLAMQEIVDPADNSPVIDHIYMREDLFEGRHVTDAPDLLAIMRDFTYMTRKGYEFAEQRGTLFREPYTNESGSHRLEGILIAAGPDIDPQIELETYDIQDLTPTILHLQDCAIPDYMDGRLIQPLFDPEFLAEHEPQYEEREMDVRDDIAREWTDQEEAEITERLKKLGYLG